MASALESQWSAIIDSQVASNLSIGAFASHSGVNRGSLVYWRRKLGRTGPPRRRRSQRSSFVELVVEEKASAERGDALVVSLPHLRAELAVSASTDLALLGRVLAALC